MENGDKIKVHERLATLETQVSSILTNHLPHLQKSAEVLQDLIKCEMKKVNTKIWWVLSTFVGFLIALVLLLIKTLL